MDTVEITWDQGFTPWNSTQNSTSSNLDKKGYYCILGATYDQTEKKWKGYTLLYIGAAFDQSIRTRLSQPHDADPDIDRWIRGHPGTQRVVMTGVISRTTQQSLTWELVNDAECCLIFSNQPACNSKCKESYSGRDILVANKGDFSPLGESAHCQ